MNGYIYRNPNACYGFNPHDESNYPRSKDFSPVDKGALERRVDDRNLRDYGYNYNTKPTYYR